MNKTSRTNEPYKPGLGGFNQSPDRLSNDLTTNQDFGDTANSTALGEEGGRALRGGGLQDPSDSSQHDASTEEHGDATTKSWLARRFTNQNRQHAKGDSMVTSTTTPIARPESSRSQPANNSAGDDDDNRGSTLQMLKKKFLTYFYFVGPGFMISVAYSTSVRATTCFFLFVYMWNIY